MATIQEQIEAVEKEIRDTPYNKSTERHHGLMRAKLAKLKDQAIAQASQGGGGGGGYAVKKQGDATIVLVGPPSVGKSTLLNKLTNAQSKVAPYAFTTVSVIPGMMQYRGAYIQILDVPGLIKGAEEGKGRGREVLSVVRGADLLIIMTDFKNIDAITSIVDALERNGIRVNKTPPDVTINKKPGGGMLIHSNIRQDFPLDSVKDIASQFAMKNGEVVLREKITYERLIDAFATNRVYTPALFVINKADEIKDKSNLSEYVLISAREDHGLDTFKEKIWDKLGFKTIYLVQPNLEPSHDEPMVVKRGTSLKEVAMGIGTEFGESKTGAKIWGPMAKFPGQEVSLSTVVEDGMQVRFL